MYLDRLTRHGPMACTFDCLPMSHDQWDVAIIAIVTAQQLRTGAQELLKITRGTTSSLAMRSKRAQQVLSSWLSKYQVRHVKLSCFVGDVEKAWQPPGSSSLARSNARTPERARQGGRKRILKALYHIVGSGTPLYTPTKPFY